MLFRGIKYCSTFEAYIDKREQLQMSLLLNKYPGEFIDKQFNRLLEKLDIDQPLTNINYDQFRQKMIHSPIREKTPVEFGSSMLYSFYVL